MKASGLSTEDRLQHAAAASPHTLRDYALLADGERGVLVDPDGRCAWMCAPRWDSEAVFSNLIGGSSHYSVALSAGPFRAATTSRAV